MAVIFDTCALPMILPTILPLILPSIQCLILPRILPFILNEYLVSSSNLHTHMNYLFEYLNGMYVKAMPGLVKCI